MVNRRPRKLKKLAKKKKAKADASIMVQCALASALSATQIAQINARPIPKFNNEHIGYAETIRKTKVLAVASIVTQAAETAQNILSRLQPWQYYASKSNAR